MTRILIVNFPYLGMDDNGKVTRNWANMRFIPERGTFVNKRRVKRLIRGWVKHTLERTLHSAELREIMKRAVWA